MIHQGIEKVLTLYPKLHWEKKANTVQITPEFSTKK